jgi:hypothetical protein
MSFGNAPREPLARDTVVHLMATPSPQYELVERDAASGSIALWRNVLVASWRDAPTPPFMRKMGDHTAAIIARYPKGYISLAFVPPIAVFPGPEFRVEAERVTKLGATHLKAIAQVVEGKGFGAATVRALISGVHMVSRNAYPSRVFDETDEAISWLLPFSEHCRDPGAIQELTALVALMRRPI